MFDLLIVGGYIILQEPIHEIKKLNIGIKNGIIAYIGDSVMGAKSYVEASESLISPAFINGHLHFGEYYLRGTGVASTAEYIDLGERFYMATKEYENQIRCSSIDNVVHESILFGSLTLCGARGWPHIFSHPINYFLGYPLMNSAKLGSYAKDFEYFFERLSTTEREKYYISLHSLQYTTTDVLQRIAKVKRLYPNCILSLHLYESIEERTCIERRMKRNALNVLQEYGLVDDKTLLVHCNYINDEDIDIIEKQHASVVVCYNSNLRLGNKPCEIQRLKDRGINIIAATDGPATGDGLSLLDNLKTIGYLTGISSWELFDMITINPASFFGSNVGQIKIGNRADLLFFDIMRPEFIYEEKLIENLIYSSGVRPKMIMKDGNTIVEDYTICDSIGRKAVIDNKKKTLELLRDIWVSNVLFKNDL